MHGEANPFINKKVEEGSWALVRIAKGGPAISHLFLWRIAFFLQRQNSSQVCLVNKVLNQFCQACSLKVNFEKSRFMALPNVPQIKCQNFANIATIQQPSSIGKYLGFPLINGRMTK